MKCLIYTTVMLMKGVFATAVLDFKNHFLFSFECSWSSINTSQSLAFQLQIFRFWHLTVEINSGEVQHIGLYWNNNGYYPF